jgi:hypothetical protein
MSLRSIGNFSRRYFYGYVTIPKSPEKPKSVTYLDPKT